MPPKKKEEEETGGARFGCVRARLAHEKAQATQRTRARVTCRSALMPPLHPRAKGACATT
jgi:hypothetical protein